jgi:hypothetical protein
MSGGLDIVIKDTAECAEVYTRQLYDRLGAAGMERPMDRGSSRLWNATVTTFMSALRNRRSAIGRGIGRFRLRDGGCSGSPDLNSIGAPCSLCLMRFWAAGLLASGRAAPSARAVLYEYHSGCLA